MSTRGTISFRINGEDKLAYNHSDSYPSGLGEDFVQQVKELIKDPEKLKTQVQNLRMVSKKSSAPTVEDIKKLSRWTDLNVSEQSTSDWYCLLRNSQGSLIDILKCGYMLDAEGFILDSLFCEYAYILNLDDGIVEFYKGFQNKKHNKGRYGQLTNPPKYAGQEPYYGCALVGTFPMDKIPENWMEKLFPND